MASLPLEVPSLEAPIDSATATVPVAGDGVDHGWSPGLRVGFRFAFCYLGGYCLLNGNATMFEAIPVWGDKVQDFLAGSLVYPAQSLAGHLFHVAPPGDTLHPTGSGDTAIEWIAHLVLLVVSLVGAAIWTALDGRRRHYQTLAAWLRFLIRLTLGFGMVSYGLVKVFPLQMPAPSIISLSEPLGMHSPMALLWNFIGMNPVYETICGGAELLGGLLLLFRRTALLGALLTAFVVTNVLLYNLCFDVPVKLYAGHLLLLALFVTLPDVRQLYRFFWLHQAGAPTGVWVPPARRAWFRRATIGIEVGFALLAVVGTGYQAMGELRERRAARAASCPLRGAWRIDAATLGEMPHPVLSERKRSFVELDVDTNARAAFRDDTGVNTSFKTKTDEGKHTVEFVRGDGSSITFGAVTPTAGRLVLTPLGKEAGTASTMTMTRVSPAEGYPLLHRGFHWVSEYPYQR